MVLLRRAQNVPQGLLIAVVGIVLICIQLTLLFETEWNTSEISAVRWFQSVFLLFCSVGAFLNLAAVRLFEKQTPRGLRLFWALMGFGFLYLAFDERFHLHEKGAALVALLTGRSSDEIDGVGGLKYFDSWLLIGYTLVGLLLLVGFAGVLIRRYARPGHLAFRYFIIAVVLATASVVVDLEVLHFSRMEDLEELLELMSSSCFFLCFCQSLWEFGQGNRLLRETFARHTDFF
jgi:drug/metabolite transporter (DMT)-like permease